MSIFGTPLDKLTTPDLTELLTDRAVENVRLEFKRDIPSKDETLKKLSSFANTYGGLLVVGAEANSTDGQITALPGVPEEPGYKQKLVQWAFDGVYPPLSVQVSAAIQTPTYPTRYCYVIAVPQSVEAPHFINGRKGAYVRSDEFSQRFRAELATYEEIQHLANRRETLVARRQGLLARSHQRFASYVERDYEKSPSTSGSMGATAMLSVCPVFPAEQLVAQGRLHDVVSSLAVDWRQANYPRLKDVVTQHESVLLLGGAWSFSIIEVTTWAHVFLAAELEEIRETEGKKPGEVEKTTGIHLYHFVGTLLAHFTYLRELFKAIGYTGMLEVSIELQRIRGVPFIVFPKNKPKVSPTSPIDDNVALRFQWPTDDLASHRDELVRQVLRSLLFAFNWPTEIRDDANVERLLQYGYWYSFWRETEP